MRYDALVLAGGHARRLGGTDKLAAEVGGRPMLDRVLAAVVLAGRVVVVGPVRETARAVLWCREEPPGGGPVAGIAAGLPYVESEYVAVIAGDLPFLDAATVDRLLAAASGHDGALLVDGEGRDQPLCAVYARAALAGALGSTNPAGRPLRDLVAGLDLVRLPDPSGAAFDTDTWHDLDQARLREAQRARDLDRDAGA